MKKHLVLSIFLSMSAFGQTADEIKNHQALVFQRDMEIQTKLMSIDPKTCKAPTSQKELIAVMGANLATLEKEGSLKHCPQLGLEGSSDTQKKVEASSTALVKSFPKKLPMLALPRWKPNEEYEVQEYLKLLDPATCKKPEGENWMAAQKRREDLKDQNGKFTHCPQFHDYTAMMKQRQLEATEAKAAALASIVDSARKKMTDQLAQQTEILKKYSLPDQGETVGATPSKFNFLSGYEGVPYLARWGRDETFAWYTEKVGSQAAMQNSFDGFVDGVRTDPNYKEEVIFGIPSRSGIFNVTVRAEQRKTYFQPYKLVYSGPVPQVIFPTPKYTLLKGIDNPGFGHQGFYSFTQDAFPNLGVKLGYFDFNPHHAAQTEKMKKVTGIMASMNSVSSGKYYYEITVLDKGMDSLKGHLFGSFEPVDKKSLLCTLKDRSNGIDFKNIAPGDVIRVALDLDNNFFDYAINKTWRAVGGINLDPVANTKRYPKRQKMCGTSSYPEGTKFHAVVKGTGGAHLIVNFGDQPWAYTPPEGYVGIPFNAQEAQEDFKAEFKQHYNIDP